MKFVSLKDCAKEMGRGRGLAYEDDILHELLKDSFPVTGYLKFPVPDHMRKKICDGLLHLEEMTDNDATNVSELTYIAGNHLFVVKVMDISRDQQESIQKTIWTEIQKLFTVQRDIYEADIMEMVENWREVERLLFFHMFGVWMDLIKCVGHDSFLLISCWSKQDGKLAKKALKKLTTYCGRDSTGFVPSKLSYNEFNLLRRPKMYIHTELSDGSDGEISSDSNDSQPEIVTCMPAPNNLQRNSQNRRSRKERNNRREQFLKQTTKLAFEPKLNEKSEEDVSEVHSKLTKLVNEANMMMVESEFVNPDKLEAQADQIRKLVKIAMELMSKTDPVLKDKLQSNINVAHSTVKELDKLVLSWKEFENILENSYKELNSYRWVLQEIKAKGRRSPAEVRQDMKILKSIQNLCYLEKSIVRLKELGLEMESVKTAYDAVKKLDEQALELDELFEEQLKIMEQQIFLFEEPTETSLLIEKETTTINKKKSEFVRVLDHWKILEAIMNRQKECTCELKYEIEQVGENKYQFGPLKKARMVRVLKSTVMVRIGGGWEHLDVFLAKHDPCQVRARRLRGHAHSISSSSLLDTNAGVSHLAEVPDTTQPVRNKKRRSKSNYR